MTKHRDLKRIIRDRMVRTGEDYATARRHVLAQRWVSGSSLTMAWPTAIRTTAAEAKALVAKAVGVETGLAEFIVAEPSAAELADGLFVGEYAFERYTEHLIAVAAYADWLRARRLGTQVNHDRSPEECRHIAQRLLEQAGGPRLRMPWVTPAEFIMAGVGLGLDYENVDREDSWAIRFKFDESDILECRRRITLGVIAGRGVNELTPDPVTGKKPRGWSRPDLVHFTDLDAFGFVGVVGAADPVHGTYAKYSDVPSEGVSEVLLHGFRTLTAGEGEQLRDDVTGPIDDFSGTDD